MPKITSPLLQLRLYVAGNAPNSERALTNVRAFCAEHLTDKYELEVIDVLIHPHQALNDRIIVTPTLLRLAPLPTRRVIGDFSEQSQLRESLCT